MNVILEKARAEDGKDITDLVNLAYRGDAGWSRESGLLTGDRVALKTINDLLCDKNIHFLVAYNLGDLLCCICIEHTKNAANLGLFAVNPKLQTLGIGKSVLEQAERYALDILNVNKLVMQVISQRLELIDFYIRRGYKRTGLVKPYPLNINTGEPILKDLSFDFLEKHQ